MQLFDTHCHLDVAEFDADRDAVIARARQLGVQDFLIPGIHVDEWPQLLDLCRRQAGCHPALGLHPIYLARHTDAHLDLLDAAIAVHRPVAVGEIGLDFALRDLDRDRQLVLFSAQLALAQRHGLPVVMHCRKAHDQLLRCLRDMPVAGGICHAFNGSIQQAEQFIELGFKLGFGGMLTFERSTKLRRLAGTLPLDAIVLETDAPDLTVASHQYQRNSPEYLPEVLHTLAALRDMDAAELAHITTANARTALRLPGTDPRISS